MPLRLYRLPKVISEMVGQTCRFAATTRRSSPIISEISFGNPSNITFPPRSDFRHRGANPPKDFEARQVGRVTPCAPQARVCSPNGAHGVTRPTLPAYGLI